MNKVLMEARRKMRNQKGKIQVGYDNTEVPEGRYTCRIAQSEIKDKEKDGVVRPQHYMRLTVEVGEQAKRSLFPFPPFLDDVDSVVQSARNIRSVLGDVVPGETLQSGEFEVDIDDYLVVIEELAHSCIGELVEVTVKDSTKSKRQDGTPFKNVYINRGLGEDAASVDSRSSDSAVVESTRGKLAFNKKKKKTAKKTAKRKAVKKKTRR